MFGIGPLLDPGTLVPGLDPLPPARTSPVLPIGAVTANGFYCPVAPGFYC